MPAWGERGVRGGGRGGTTEKTSPLFGPPRLASAARPQGREEYDSPRGPSAPSRSLPRLSPARLLVDTGVRSRPTRFNPPPCTQGLSPFPF